MTNIEHKKLGFVWIKYIKYFLVFVQSIYKKWGGTLYLGVFYLFLFFFYGNGSIDISYRGPFIREKNILKKYLKSCASIEKKHYGQNILFCLHSNRLSSFQRKSNAYHEKKPTITKQV